MSRPVLLDLNASTLLKSNMVRSPSTLSAEETGFSERISTGSGLVTFRNMDEAAPGVADIDANYSRHIRAARELAPEIFDSRKCLPPLLAACDP